MSRPPSTFRLCVLCRAVTKWVYNPSRGHSDCNVCGATLAGTRKLSQREADLLRNILHGKGDIDKWKCELRKTLKEEVAV